MRRRPSTHQQHEVIEPLAGLVGLHRADPRGLEGLVVGRQRDVQRVRVGQQEGNTHPLHTHTHRETDEWIFGLSGRRFLSVSEHKESEKQR